MHYQYVEERGGT